MKKDLFKVRLFSLAGLLVFLLTLASCANEEVVQKATNTGDDSDKNLTTFSTGSPESRTTMDYSTGAFYWEAGDYIYVKDDNNVWRKSKNTPTAKTASFNFKVDGDFNNSATYKVYYPGKNGTNDQVTIPDEQTQTMPNSTEHFGVSGDCGIADATGTVGGKAFSFKLDHQATYLVFQPYTNNNILQRCYLTKVEVTSDNDITDIYTLDSTTGSLTGGAGTGKQIVLTTKGSGIYVNGFPLTNASASVATNGAFMIIKPGIHALKIRYWLKDISTGIQGTITKAFSARTFDKNKYYNMISNLDTRAYDGHHYYMWDAKQNYWAGHEWDSADPWQPISDSQPLSNIPTSNTDPRWYNENSPGLGIRYDAQTALFKSLPNPNEMSWYTMKGNPSWDKDELWTTMGKLFKGGIWLKKKSVLQAEGNYSTEYSADGTTDMRTTYGYYINNGFRGNELPTATNASQYFYLPALGYDNALGNLGNYAAFWLSSASPLNSTKACYTLFGSGFLVVSNGAANRSGCYIAQPFSDFGDN